MTAYFSVKNFEKFQHYKDRTPPWIKLYNELLDDYDFGLLPDASKAHLLAIWLLASRYSNRIPYDTDWISRHINATETPDLKMLEKTGFIVVDQGRSDLLADCAKKSLEEETETETDIPYTSYKDAKASIDPDVTLFQEGKAVLGSKSGGQITKLKKACAGDPVKALDTIRLASRKQDPAEYVAGIIRAGPSEPVNIRKILDDNSKAPQTDWAKLAEERERAYRESES